jgi:DNA modification methylase
LVIVVDPKLRTGRNKAFPEQHKLFDSYSDTLIVNDDLNRALVSFQAAKNSPVFRWFKYKEAFSPAFVSHVLGEFRPAAIKQPVFLDPFSGSGTGVVVAANEGWSATGIELMPLGPSIVKARIAASRVNPSTFKSSYEKFLNHSLARDCSVSPFPQLRIAQGAFPAETEGAISSYMTFLKGIRNPDIRFLFWFACLSSLEDVSYTRKDGQYLRWDSRSGRATTTRFNKGQILDFRTALRNQLMQILNDLESNEVVDLSGRVQMITGSCLTELARLQKESFNLVITSPPYCNRYDYTRTYALELAYLGYNDCMIKELRQTLLSATVENKSKSEELAIQYEAMGEAQKFGKWENDFYSQRALQEVLDFLRSARDNGLLNNNNIVSMVENYFYEMNLVIHELARVLAPGGHVVMVNDNVQYCGHEVPVDLILSDLASRAGLEVKFIWVLPKGKGNSSQQMAAYGRNEIRKCVYVWSKPKRKRTN